MDEVCQFSSDTSFAESDENNIDRGSEVNGYVDNEVITICSSTVSGKGNEDRLLSSLTTKDSIKKAQYIDNKAFLLKILYHIYHPAERK